MFRTGRRWWFPWRGTDQPQQPGARPAPAPLSTPAWATAPTAEYRPRVLTLGQLTAYQVVRPR
jgi:hypothetical protein